MVEIVMGPMGPPYSYNNNLLLCKRLYFCIGERKGKLRSCPKRQAHIAFVKNQMVNPSTYSTGISTDIPLYESPGASFDRYLEDKPRVFRAIFPDKQRSHQLNEEEWRVHMLPINFLFLTVWPVIDMRLRCKTEGLDYPPGVPRDITKVLELDIMKWDLQGLDDVLKPSQFSLGVKGVLYPDRRGLRSRLKGQLHMSISFVLPPVLALVPEHVRRDVAESVLSQLVENMKHKVNGSLLADYSEFKREKPKSFMIGVSSDDHFRKGRINEQQKEAYKNGETL